MEQREGYKSTKVGWIPEEWEVKSIGYLYDFKNGLNKEKEFFGYGTPIVNYKDIYSNTFIGRKNIKGLVSLNESELNRFEARKGDVFFTRTSETVAEIGLAAVLVDDIENCVFSGFILRARPKNGDVNFLFSGYCFSSINVRQEIIRKSSFTTRALTNGRFLSEVQIPLPPLPEQEAIAEILMKWDEAIAQTEALLEQLRLRLRGLQQQLLSAKKRLPGFQGDWKTVKLGEVISINSKPVPKPSTNYLALGLRSHGKGIFHKPDIDPNKVSMDTLYRVEENELIVNITFAWEQAIAIVNKEDCEGLVSHRFPTYKFNSNGSHKYFKYLIRTKYFKHLMGLISPGGAGRNRVMSKKDFIKLKITIPPIAEQEAIAEVLAGASAEIAQYEAYMLELQAQKKGLMQQLLTGQVRVV